jgi:hypothetical protein
MTAEAIRIFTFYWLVACFLATAVALWCRPRAVPAALLLATALLVRLAPWIVFRMPPGAAAAFDTESYRIVAQLLRAGQDVYSHTTRHPYLPLQMYVMALASWVADLSGLDFAMLVKLPAIAADAVIPLVIARWTSESVTPATAARAALVYALNPMSTLIVALHGQFDSLPLLFLLWSLLRLRGGRDTRSVALSGLLFGLAILWKTWPVILAPLLLAQLPSWRHRGLFAVSLAAVPLVGGALYCVALGVGPRSMAAAVSNYSSLQGRWGYPMILQRLSSTWDWTWAEAARQWTVPWAREILAVGLIAGTVAAISQPLERGCALVILAFYIFTYGWGGHYIMWLQPFALLGAPPLLAAVYVLVSTALMLARYFFYGAFYAQILRHVSVNSPAITYVWSTSAALWLLCVVLFVAIARRPPHSLDPR